MTDIHDPARTTFATGPTLGPSTESPVIADLPANTPTYAWYVLSVFFLISCLNFIDRQVLSILAEDVKRDLGLSDQDLGFLYGTAFGVFYALFGIPLGRLADSWNRGRLLSIGLSVWSLMTAISGLARDGVVLSLARVGVGVGEATASPTVYSLLSDWFAPHRRATALAIYSAGVFVGSGISLGLAGVVVKNWNLAYPGGGPFGLTGWRVAFLVVGLPGVILALWTATRRQPVRVDAAVHSRGPMARGPFRIFLAELYAILPPLTLLDAARRGWNALAINVAMACCIAAAVAALIWTGEPLAQWSAYGVGVYSVASWSISLRRRDRSTFDLVVSNPAMIFTTLSYGLNAFVAYSVLFWTAPYAIRILHIDPALVGLYVGGTGAAAGFLGVTLGGVVSDRLLRRDARGRLLVVIFGAFAPAPFVLLAYSSTALWTLCLYTFLAGSCAATALGASGATVQDLVLPRMRGTAIAAFTIGTTLLGLALGPYLVGRISTVSGDLPFALRCLVLSSPLAVAAGVMAYQTLPAALTRRDLAERCERGDS